ncbi:MAG: VOC family protein [Solirubrobacteraceae bacterium]
MAKVDGHSVGALFETDAPPRWNSYVTVASVDATAEQARELGGRVVADPFNVMDAGRMAVIQDPSGGVVNVWEAREHIGAGLVNAPGALAWNDLMTHDVGTASEFYCALFGWEVGTVEDAPDDRVVIRNGERLNGGMAKIPGEVGEEIPPHWLAYFAVADVEAAVETAKAAGGEAMAGPIEIPVGEFALLADPQGAVFAVFAGDFED